MPSQDGAMGQAAGGGILKLPIASLLHWKNDFHPRPIFVLIASLTNVGVPCQAAPRSVTRDVGNLWNGPAKLEQAAYAFVAQVV